VLAPTVSDGMPPTFVAAESVPSMLLGVVVFTSAEPELPQAPSNSPASKTVAGAKYELELVMN
jgi:hypothetical protein